LNCGAYGFSPALSVAYALIASNIQLWLSHSPAGLGRHMVSQEYNISKLLEFEITCIVFVIMYFSFSFDLFPPLHCFELGSMKMPAPLKALSTLADDSQRLDLEVPELRECTDSDHWPFAGPEAVHEIQ